MPRKLRQLRADLRREGFSILHQKGSHETWSHPLLPSAVVVLAGHDGADSDRYQVREVQAAIAAVQALKRQQGGGKGKP